MAETKKPAKREKWTSPAGEANWVFVDKPRPKYRKPDEHEYTATVNITKPQYEELVKFFTPKAEKIKADAIAAAKNKKEANELKECELHLPVKANIDPETGEPDGTYSISAKRNSTWFNQKTNETVQVTIPVFDSSAPPKPMKSVKIGRGSKIKIACSLVPFAMAATGKAGISLSLEAVQVIDLVPVGSSNDPKSFGFGGEAGGYTASEESEPAPFGGGSEPETVGSTTSGDF